MHFKPIYEDMRSISLWVNTTENHEEQLCHVKETCLPVLQWGWYMYFMNWHAGTYKMQDKCIIHIVL